MTFCIILVAILFLIILWGGMTRWGFVKGRVKEGYAKENFTENQNYGSS